MRMQYQILRESETWGDIPCQASGRIVLQKISDIEYATHYENLENPQRPYLTAGHYFNSLDTALLDYAKRVTAKW